MPPKTALRQSDENAWLDWVRRQVRPAAVGGLRLGIGDDAAIVRPRSGWEIAVTTDLMIEGTHFRRGIDRPEDCGYRLAMRGLSDLAAMGAEPWMLFFSALWPKDEPPAWRRSVHRGLTQAAHAAGATLAGGDVSSGVHACFDIVALGQIPRGQALRRDGARPGDRIFVSGTLGQAAWGRQMLDHGHIPQNPRERSALRRCQRPCARWELGEKLRGLASAAMDLSDGLSSDLDRLCAASGVHARVDETSLPLAGPAGVGQNFLALALHGGEDYELLFTVPRRKLAALTQRTGASIQLTEIGEILPVRRARKSQPRLWLQAGNGRSQPLAPQGWDALRPHTRH